MNKPEYSLRTIAAYEAFRDRAYNAKSVLHPGCGLDASPAKVFRSVTFVDKDEDAMRVFSEHGLEAECVDIGDYRSTEFHDLLLLLNPGFPTELAAQHMRPGSYILSNNYHDNATAMHYEPDKYTLWGTIDYLVKDMRKGDHRVEISRRAEGLFEPCRNGGDIMVHRPEYFDFLVKMFKGMEKNMKGFSAEGPFDEVHARYREVTHEGMPAKRTADFYIFMKDKN